MAISCVGIIWQYGLRGSCASRLGRLGVTANPFVSLPLTHPLNKSNLPT